MDMLYFLWGRNWIHYIKMSLLVMERECFLYSTNWICVLNICFLLWSFGVSYGLRNWALEIFEASKGSYVLRRKEFLDALEERGSASASTGLSHYEHSDLSRPLQFQKPEQPAGPQTLRLVNFHTARNYTESIAWDPPRTERGGKSPPRVTEFTDITAIILTALRTD